MSALEQRVFSILADWCGDAPVVDQDISSLDHVDRLEMAMALEMEFNVMIPDQDIESWSSLRGVVSTVQTCLAQHDRNGG